MHPDQLMNSTQPINRLPAELLVQTFLLSEKQTHHSKSGFYPHLRLSWVCQYWRQIINRSPVFWTVIMFLPWKGKSFIEELIFRSGSAESTVFFSPKNRDSLGSQININEILPVFDNLLEREGYRIKFLALTANPGDKIPGLLSGKKLPALKAFVSTEVMELLGIQSLQSAKHLQYLRIYRFPGPSLSLLQLSFHCFKGLHITFNSFQDTTKFFSTCLPLCYNLESLITVTESNQSEISNASPPFLAITLPKLIFLHTDYYSCIDQIRAPALKKIKVYRSLDLGATQHKYSIFDDYDVSSVTSLYIVGLDLFMPKPSIIQITGSTGSIQPLYRLNIPLTQFDTDGVDIDLRGELLPFISSSEPTQFYFSTRYLNNTDHLSQNFFLPTLFSKLYNLETISINPFDASHIHPPLEMPDAEDVESFRGFIKTIFGNLTSVKPRRLIFEDREGYLDLLQILFELINTYPVLSNLNQISFHIDEWFDYSISGHQLGEEFVDFLRARREAGYEALQEFEVTGGEPIAEECIAEAAKLGTRLYQKSPFPPNPNGFNF